MGIELYNSELPEGQNVWTAPTEEAASVLEKSGWSRTRPQAEAEEKVEADRKTAAEAKAAANKKEGGN